MAMRFHIKSAGIIIFALAIMANTSSDIDIKAGKRIYIQCSGCHAPNYNRTGPKHCGILGRAAGGVESFEYTKAMANSGIIWTNKSLDKFLISPLSVVPGTSMGFAGIASEVERQQLIAYLSQLDEKNTLCN